MVSRLCYLYRLDSPCIRLNQSAIRPRFQQEVAMKKEHQEIFDKVQSHLIDRPHHILRNNPIFKQYHTHLLDHLKHSYSSPISYKDRILANEQARVAQSIRAKIKQHRLILHVLDKGNNFYIASAENLEQK